MALLKAGKANKGDAAGADGFDATDNSKKSFFFFQEKKELKRRAKFTEEARAKEAAANDNASAEATSRAKTRKER